MFDALHISSTGLSAESLRISVIAENLANQDTTATPAGGPYRRQFVQLMALPANAQGVGQGVEVQGIYQDPAPFISVHNPGAPGANAQGNVLYPNVNLSTEMVDLIQAESAYQANANAFQADKSLYLKAFSLGA